MNLWECHGLSYLQISNFFSLLVSRESEVRSLSEQYTEELLGRYKSCALTETFLSLCLDRGMDVRYTQQLTVGDIEKQ